MRFKEFLKEYAGGMDIDTACKKIKQECKYFLSASKGKALYRGIRGISPEAGVVFSKAPKNRAAKDSSDGFNLMFNTAFDLAFDYPSIRSNCMYATGNVLAAHMYGPTYFIFPKGDFAFTYSPEYEDSFEDSSKMYNAIGDAIEDKIKFRIPSHNLADVFEQLATVVGPKEFIKGGPKVDSALSNAIESNLEDDELEKSLKLDLHKILIDGLKKTFKQDYIDSDDLARAISLKHEIGFYEFEGYYAVPTQLVYETMKKDKSELGDRFKDEIPEAKHEPHRLYPYLLNIISES